MHEYDDLPDDPQISHNQVFREVPVKRGRAILVNHPNRYDGAVPPLRHLALEIGADTRAVLGELGYGTGEIEALLARGAIQAPRRGREGGGRGMSDDFHVKVGDQVQFAKTVGESDVYLFAGITGDLSSNHVDEAVMQRSSYGRRIAHGALLIGFMSTTSTLMIEKSGGVGNKETPVSLGYDRIRFLAPVFIGDTITVTYKIAEIDPAAPPLALRDRGHQPGRHAGRGRPAHSQMGRQPRRHG